jgi:hypothetical protein
MTMDGVIIDGEVVLMLNMMMRSLVEVDVQVLTWDGTR